MDRVKLGRALGYGTRHAAKTVAAVVEAASAPGSGPASPSVTSRTRSSAEAPCEPVRRPAMTSARPVATEVRQGARALWKPLAVYSGALWLRVTGLFFAVIAVSLGSGAWRLRRAYRPGSPGVHHFWIFLGFAAAFAYFAVSGFLRANLKERRAVRELR